VCGSTGTWVAENGKEYGTPGNFVWDDEAQAKHDATYGKRENAR
jgi:hypothetical protein